ncbi:hypothetical protein [Rubrivirga sp.]|uniref:hypothetical protein n=1 Tax=Rubrivirga sp. TaxID=1885344 RepID=UPI003B516F69
MREAYRLHDGERDDGKLIFGPYRWVPLGEIAKHRHSMLEVERKFGGNYRVWYGLGDYDPDLMIPVLECGENYGYVESVASREQDGPLIEWSSDSGRKGVEAESFAAYVSAYVGKVLSDQCVFVPEPGYVVLIPKDEY